MTVTDPQRLLGEIQAGNLLIAYDGLRAALDAGSDDPDLRYLYVLALARMGLTDRALTAYEQLRIAEIATTDAQSLFARLLKDCALAEEGALRQPALLRAAQAYQDVYADTGNPYPAVNAASLYLLGDQPDAAQSLAADILNVALPEKPDYYDLATRAEADIVLGRYASAEQTLGLARTASGAGTGARAGTMRQLRMLLAHQGLQPDRAGAILAGLQTGAAVFYCGRMFAEAPEIEGDLAQQVRDFAQQHDVAAAFGSLACGADILVAEVMQSLDIPVFVVLASPPEAFVVTSVRNGGGGWEKRFHTCLNAAAEVHVTNDAFHASDPLAFAVTARVASGMAVHFAEQNLCSARQLAILGGADSFGGTAGTNADMDRWRALGREATVLRADGITRPASPPAKSDPVMRREVSLLFADFAGFSKLSDAHLPELTDRALTALANVLDANGQHVLFRNTWGDACFAVFSDPIHAAEVALSLLAQLRSSKVSDSVRGLRISLHHGIAMEIFDPVLGRPNFFGAEVSRAARIEPITPLDSAYASQQFVSALAGKSNRQVRFDYVGHVPLPKNFGTERLYLLSGMEPEPRDGP